MRRFVLFFEDLCTDAQWRIMQKLQAELTDDIDAAVAAGQDRSTAEAEILSDRLNRNNTGFAVEL